MFRVQAQSDSLHELKIDKEKSFIEAKELRVQLKEVEVCSTELYHIRPHLCVCAACVLVVTH